jgi:hypothetical protein
MADNNPPELIPMNNAMEIEVNRDIEEVVGEGLGEVIEEGIGEVDPQLLHERKVKMITHSLQRYLETPKIPLEDPIYDLNNLTPEEREAKLCETAQIMKFYGPSLQRKTVSLQKNKQKPRLRVEVTNDPSTCWKKLKRYRICIHGHDDEVWQTGDYVKLSNKQYGKILYFTHAEDHSCIQAHILIYYNKSHFTSSVWQSFIRNADTWIETDIQITTNLGDIEDIVSQPVIVSDFLYQNNCLRARVDTQIWEHNLSRTLMQTYLITEATMLPQHVLVRTAANFVSMFCRPDFLSQLILQDFMPYSLIFKEQDDDNDGDFSEIALFHKISLREDICSLCSFPGKLVFEGSDNNQTTACEACFVRLRKIYNQIFSKLEPWRKNCLTKQYICTPEDDQPEEITNAIQSLLKNTKVDSN